MAKRPRPHVTSDQAVAAVRAIWAQQGAAVEEIRKDYGEDLLIQTQLRGRMDGSRIWMQVKGTTVDLSDDIRPLPPIRVKSTLALRWARTSDLVVLVLWDAANNIGWFAEPQNLHTEFELTGHRGPTTTIALSRADTFNASTADYLAWHGRLRHAEIQLLQATQRAAAYGQINATVKESSARGRAGIIFRVMEDVQIVDSDHNLTDGFTRVFAGECESFASENDDFHAFLRDRIAAQAASLPSGLSAGNRAESSPEMADGILRCILITLTKVFQDRTGLGVPAALANDLATVIYGTVMESAFDL